jgi:hypothetical protein
MKVFKPKSIASKRRRKSTLLAVLFAAGVYATLPARPFRPIEPIPTGIVDGRPERAQLDY